VRKEKDKGYRRKKRRKKTKADKKE